MALVPQVCDTVTIPVIAAGGIADGRTLRPHFALGAEGVQVGTSFLTVEECTSPKPIRTRCLRAKDSDTIVTGRATGHPVRCLKNPWSRSDRTPSSDAAASTDELEGMYAGSLRRAVEGDVDGGSFMAGQAACLVHGAKARAMRCEELMGQGASRASLDLQGLADASASRAVREKELAHGESGVSSFWPGFAKARHGGDVVRHARNRRGILRGV